MQFRAPALPSPAAPTAPSFFQIYGARPLQCQTYPWWPELMSDRSWVAEAGAVCEGINHATATATDLEGAALLLQAQVEHEIIFGDGRAMGGWNL